MEHWQRATRKGAVLAVVTLLHLLLFVYLSMPPAPAYSRGTARTSRRTGALQLVFLQRPMSANHAKPSPREAAVARAMARSAQPTRKSVPKVPDKQRFEMALQASGQAHPQDTGTQQQAVPADSPYENPLLKDIHGGAPGQAHASLPGHADGELVKSISVDTQPSPRQVLQHVGKFMNCSQVRIARFLSASEMDKRHITAHELDQAFTEFGCS